MLVMSIKSICANFAYVLLHNFSIDFDLKKITGLRGSNFGNGGI